jgi:hypothetical protein
VDARNFFAASANCLERNQLRGALGGAIKQDESHVGVSVIGHNRKIPVRLDTGRRVAEGRSHGSQWLYLLKGAPTVLAGIVFMSLLADHPDQVSWLTALEKRLLGARTAEKQTSVSEGRRLSALLDASRKFRADWFVGSRFDLLAPANGYSLFHGCGRWDRVD